MDGLRVVGYDNERGKGDHKHIDSVEYDYRFVSYKKLKLDFLAAVAEWKEKHYGNQG